MKEARYHKHRLANHELHPETLMLGYGYDPLLSEGAVKPPVFLTSTFVFRTAEEVRDFFDYTSGRREPPPGSSTRASTTPTARSSRIAWPPTKAQRRASCSRPACRRSRPASSPSP